MIWISAARLLRALFPGLLAALLLFLVGGGAHAAATLVNFEADSGARGVTVRWSTTDQANHAGFILMRAASLDGPRERLNDELIVSQESDENGVTRYEWQDDGAGEGPAYYWLQEVSTFGTIESHGPAGAALTVRPTAVSLAGFDAGSRAPSPLLPLLALAALLLLVARRLHPRLPPVPVRR